MAIPITSTKKVISPLKFRVWFPPVSGFCVIQL